MIYPSDILYRNDNNIGSSVEMSRGTSKDATENNDGGVT